MRTGLQHPHPTHALGKMIEAHDAGTPFTVTGVDWPTRDGSGLRDYIHVWDLARAHVSVLQRFDDVVEASGYEVINLGTGQGTTVFELAHAFGEATASPLEVRTGPARPGDVVGCASRTDKAREVLGWSAERSLVDGVRDSPGLAEKPARSACRRGHPVTDAQHKPRNKQGKPRERRPGPHRARGADRLSTPILRPPPAGRG